VRETLAALRATGVDECFLVPTRADPEELARLVALAP